jgi:hypothetical protein
LRFECYDAYGRLEHQLEGEVENFSFETMMIDVNGKFYQSMCYRFEGQETICQCTPVSVIKMKQGGMSGTVQEE